MRTLRALGTLGTLRTVMSMMTATAGHFWFVTVAKRNILYNKIFEILHVLLGSKHFLHLTKVVAHGLLMFLHTSFAFFVFFGVLLGLIGSTTSIAFGFALLIYFV